MLLGVIREAGELDSRASSVDAAPETAGPLSECSVWKRRGWYEISNIGRYENML